ncbi:zinc finger, GRF-type [Artemisia annua]|uniref:Zinc finger, GRF-type n=1 Tax=Artemisia annua TaxID=35608 RepID=A0A2U1N8A9_ARTAN|nr:zinc finger, GRF-type [Artemisia annua]
MVNCFCGNQAVMRTSWTHTNPGRRFWSCAQIVTNCGFFLWFDPPMCARARAIIPGLLTARNALEALENIVDEEHMVDEVEVPMKGFRFEVEDDFIDSGNPKLNLTENDLEVIDFDSFESDIEDDEESARRKGIRKLRKLAGNSTSTTGFFVGKEFPNRDVAKDMIRAHAVETRRCIQIVKNDKMRVRAQCFGVVPEPIRMTKGKITTREKVDTMTVVDQSKKMEGIFIGKGGQEDKPHCPWVLYISKGEKGKWGFDWNSDPDIQLWSTFQGVKVDMIMRWSCGSTRTAMLWNLHNVYETAMFNTQSANDVDSQKEVYQKVLYIKLLIVISIKGADAIEQNFQSPVTLSGNLSSRTSSAFNSQSVNGANKTSETPVKKGT